MQNDHEPQLIYLTHPALYGARVALWRNAHSRLWLWSAHTERMLDSVGLTVDHMATDRPRLIDRPTA